MPTRKCRESFKVYGRGDSSGVVFCDITCPLFGRFEPVALKLRIEKLAMNTEYSRSLRSVPGTLEHRASNQGSFPSLAVDLLVALRPLSAEHKRAMTQIWVSWMTLNRAARRT